MSELTNQEWHELGRVWFETVNDGVQIWDAIEVSERIRVIHGLQEVARVLLARYDHEHGDAIAKARGEVHVILMHLDNLVAAANTTAATLEATLRATRGVKP